VLILGLQMTTVVWIGAHLVLDNKISIGALFACLAMREQLNTRTVALVDRLAEIRMLDVQAARVADITTQKIEVRSPRPLVQQAKTVIPDVVAKGLYFRYGDTEPWLLADADLNIRPQECIAITGPSGIGKSTLTKLLAGLLNPNKGEVRVGGISVSSHRNETSSMISFVMQDDALFSGTLAENIHFFDESPDFGRVLECALMAAIASDIAAMPMRYDTLVGDMGTTLSGGQKQRVLLARALYRSPGVLVLDEATSHLDIPTERAIFETLTKLPMTRIIIAHRYETLSVADRIVILRDGKFENLPHPNSEGAAPGTPPRISSLKPHSGALQTV
jgi:ATP-binding cassette subfamily B protein RaxB